MELIVFTISLTISFIIDAFSTMKLNYGETFVLEGSKYKYKKIRNANPQIEAILTQNPHLLN